MIFFSFTGHHTGQHWQAKMGAGACDTVHIVMTTQQMLPTGAQRARSIAY